MTIRIAYDEAEPNTEARRAFDVALEAGVMTASASAPNYAGKYIFIGDDGEPKWGRAPRHFLFEHEEGAGLLKLPIPDAEPEPDDDREAPPSYITSAHMRALQWAQQHPGTTLTSVRIDGEPSVAVVIVDTSGGAMRVMPLFVGITTAMEIEYLEFDYHERGGKSRNGGRSPKRAFDAEAEVTKPQAKIA